MDHYTSVFDFKSYKQCVNNWIESQPKGGHGQLRRMAEFLRVNSVVMSQIFRGTRDLTSEQAVQICKFMGFSDPQRDYFLLLVNYERAGSLELKEVINSQIEAAKKAANALKNRIKHSKFTEEDRATFYSQWYYSAVRLGVSIESMSTVSAIAAHLKIERALASKVVAFLLEHGLVVEKSGRLDMGPQVTHVGHDSPFVNRHHTNWRLKGLQAIEGLREDELFYTGPMAISNRAAKEIRKDIVALIERSTKAAADSKSEVLNCLNIDWFRI